MQIFNRKKKLECLRDFLITAGILAAATGIGFGFYTLGFSEENIIIVYLLGAMIVAVLTASRVWSGLAALFSVLLFNYLFTVPRFSFSAYGSGYPVTFVIAFIAAMIVGNLAVQLKRQAERSDKMAYRTQILLETNQMLQRAVNEKEIVEETAGQIVKLFGRSVVCYRRNKKIWRIRSCIRRGRRTICRYIFPMRNGRPRSGHFGIISVQAREPTY